MVFGKIEYLNLLPFDFFIKHSRYTYLKKAVKKSHPAVITDMFLKRKVSAAFISSIKSKKQKCLDAGIVANKEVLSVFVCKGENKQDTESKSSNMLKNILGLEGEVVIGDKALQMYAKENRECIDMAKEWNKRTSLPFVFAVFCINSKDKYYQKVIKKFSKTKIKLPYYIKKKQSLKLGISIHLIDLYLKKIGYKIGNKEKKSVKLFLKKAKEVENKKTRS